MKHAADAPGERRQLRERVLQRLALVNDAVESEFGGHLQLLTENVSLLPFVLCIIRVGEARLLTWQMMIIQPDLANGDDLRMPGQFAQRGAKVPMETILVMPAALARSIT